MPKAIINLTVSDLPATRRFFEALGFSFNEQFSSDQTAGLEISDTIRAMLHTPESMRRFTGKEIADAHHTTEVLLALQLDSREAVDAMLDKVLAAGGREARPTEDHGFAYTRAFEDLDGHIWEPFFMDMSRLPT